MVQVGSKDQLQDKRCFATLQKSHTTQKKDSMNKVCAGDVGTSQRGAGGLTLSNHTGY